MMLLFQVFLSVEDRGGDDWPKSENFQGNLKVRQNSDSGSGTGSLQKSK
jgi:hypothetical protein